MLSSGNTNDAINEHVHAADFTDSNSNYNDRIVGGANISSNGKIFLNTLERTKFTPALAAFTDIKFLQPSQEQSGDLPATSDLDALRGGKAETYGTLSKKEKIEFILQQILLTLAKKDYVRAHIIGNKINSKALDEEGMESYRGRFFELMAEYHRHEKDAYELSKDYHAIYSTHIRITQNSSIKDGENTDKEETKDSADTENEEKWMAALRTTVLFLALSPHTPEQNDTLHRISTDANLQKIQVCRDIVHTLLQKHATLDSLPHQSEMELWNAYATTNASNSNLNSNSNFNSNSNSNSNSTSAMIDNDNCMMENTNVNVSGEDHTHSQHLCTSSGVFSGGMIARIGRRFTTSVLGMQEPKPLLALPSRSNIHEGEEEQSAILGVHSNGGQRSDAGELLGIATHRISYGLPILVPNHEEERHKNDRREDTGIISNGKRQGDKPQILIKRNGTHGGEKRLRHQSLPYIPSSFDNTPIIELSGLQTSYDSPCTPKLCNEANVSSSQHSLLHQMESPPIIEDDTNNDDDFVDANHHLPHEHAYEELPPQRDRSLSSRPSVCTTIPLRSPQQSLWLENAMHYERKGNYASALYYYELYLVQLRESNNTFHCQHSKSVPSDCVGEVQNSEHNRTSYSLAIEMAWLLHKVGVVRWKTGEYAKSLSPLLEATSSLRRFYLSSSCGSDNRKFYGVGLVEVLNSMGRIYLSRGECQQARIFFEESYGILSIVYAQPLPDSETTGMNTHRKVGGEKENDHINRNCKLESSELILKGTQNNASGTIMHPSMAQTIIAIGMIDNMQGQFNRALQKCRRGYYIQCRILCPDHVDIAATLNVIGIVHGKMGHFNKALKYHKKALKIYESVSVCVLLRMVLVSVYWLGFCSTYGRVCVWLWFCRGDAVCRETHETSENNTCIRTAV